jgi:hypothetical protein
MSELKYTVGDEVLIKGKVLDAYEGGTSSYPYRIRFDDDNIALSWSECFSESSIVGMASDLVKAENQKTYEQGLNDAWEMARIITAAESENGIPIDRLKDIYGSSELDIVAKNYTAQEAINIYEDWKESHIFKMGDVVEYYCAEELCRAIFLYEGLTCYWVLTHDDEAPQQLTKAHFKLRKVGESGLDIAGELKKVREME